VRDQSHKNGFFRRFFAPQNIAAVAAGLVAFALALQVWDSNRGAVIAAAVGGLVSAIVWLIWNQFAGLRPVEKLVDLPQVGSIPDSIDGPAPTLTHPSSSAAAAYQRAASRLEAATPGRVLLVAGIEAGQGATSAALNLAVAATKAGRRTLLIDGDVGRGNLSRFGRTGTSPGLSDIASGDATLRDAARLWSIDGTSRLPFVPSGGATINGSIDRIALAGAIEDVTTAADLVLIDTAPTNGAATSALGAVADGTLLVLPKAADRVALESACDRADRVGAPAVGFLINEAAPSPKSIDQHPILRSLKRGVATAVLVLLAYTGWNGLQLWDSWAGVGREGFDTADANDLLLLPTEGIVDAEVDPETASVVTAVPAAEGDYLSMLIIGSDLSGGLADVIMLAVLPGDGSEPMLVSLPRDLYLPNRCTQSYTKLNANLNGCGDDVNGPTLLALAVTDFTGIPIDHFALFTFDGFEQIIDEVGGIQICVEHAVRDSKSDLDLPAGCTQATGAQALSWVRSRRTQELVDGRWRTMANVSDITRNERQQEVLLEMFSKLRTFDSPSDLTGTVRSLTDAFTLDNQLGLTDAISLAWGLRDIDPTTVVSLSIPVASDRTSSGASILVPTASFDQVLADGYPDLAADRESASTDRTGQGAPQS
jgi:LCP family protein required for cell wall assembly